ncbi:MAG: helix-turn-helix domain-containing protein [Clostridia bacterium]|nr:helix-turn-helix domain-containing protein [Clostridia bacterium]
MWYDNSMEENTLLLNQTIAKNLSYYRKRAGLTQAELAEKINYSDKSVSKWESAGGVPDVYILVKLAQLYGVTLNDLVGESPKKEPKESRTGLHILIIALSVGIVWLLATCAFVVLRLVAPFLEWPWLTFVYAVPTTAVVMLVFACIWRYKMLNFVSTTILIWSALTSVFLTALLVTTQRGSETEGLWTLFLIGAPLQVLEVLWAFFRYSVFKAKNVEVKKQKKEDKDGN